VLNHDEAALRLGQLCSMRMVRNLGTVVIRLHGEFDMACARRLADELNGALEHDTEVLVMDLCGLQFIDSTGLGMLITLNRTTNEAGIEYTVLCRDDGPVRHILRESGLDGLLPVVDPHGTVPSSDSPV
jgi:anti-sigma B factor antagonist